MLYEHSSWISYKFGKPGLRTKIISDMQGYFEWKSTSTPAGKHDFIQLLSNELTLQAVYDGEYVCADKGYEGESVLNIVHLFKRANEGSEQMLFNNRLRRIGSTLKRSFGFLKKRFHIFQLYRGPIQEYDLLLGFAMAITNDIRRTSQIDAVYNISEAEWNEIDRALELDRQLYGVDTPLYETWERIYNSGQTRNMLRPTEGQLSLSRNSGS